MIESVQKRILMEGDPVGGVWKAPSNGVTKVWCNASSIASGVCLEVDGRIVEGGSWLMKVDGGAHINLAELDAVIRGINLVISWKLKIIEVLADSSTVYGWLQSLI